MTKPTKNLLAEDAYNDKEKARELNQMQHTITPELVREWLSLGDFTKNTNYCVSWGIICLHDLAHAYLRQSEALEVAMRCIEQYQPMSFNGRIITHTGIAALEAKKRIDAIMKEGE